MRKLMLAAAVVLSMAVPAAAQEIVYRFEKQADGAGAQGDFFTLAVPPHGGPDGLIEQRMGLLAVEPFEAGNPITGAPYTAEIVTEVVQTLADGNRIERRTTASVARDSQGRIRREQQLAAIGALLPEVDRRMITIMNPVDGTHYSLDPVRKVAMRSPMPTGKPLQGGIARTQIVIGTGPVATATDVETIVKRRAADPGQTESLGTSVIEGVQAEGTRTTVTIAAGTIGNQAPIQMVSERWFSPELGVVVMSRRSDPRFGETTYRLQNIARGEPSPELFQLPSDYKVEALPAFGR